MPTTKPTAPRKRNRKRKRRLASSSSSSSSSDSASSDETPVKKAPLKKQATPSSAEEPSSSSSSPSSSDSEDDALHESNALPLPAVSRVPFVKTQGSERVKARSPSPSPPPVDLPPFLPSEGSGGRAEEEQALRDRFRQFWMASVADAFSDDLERIRKEPSMTKSRLALLIDSLASGGEVFSSRAGERGEMNEMEVVLNSDHND
ncbi:hypothetical protein EDB83DRAFT_2345454 [Lactarius deliciosus]|nr:hypothetical protein EDB83DRAFT_2345454 [Lactarius deliciosus]